MRLLSLLIVLVSAGMAEARYCNNPNCAMCNRIFGPMTSYYQQSVAVSPKVQTSVSQNAAEAPTPHNVVDAMLKVADIRDGEIVYDLGCGDGRILKAAWEDYRARGVGIEISPAQVRRAKENCKGMPITIVFGDCTTFKLSEADVVALYLYPKTIERLAPKLTNARVVVSYCHPVPGFRNTKVEVDGHIFYVADPERKPPEVTWRIASK